MSPAPLTARVVPIGRLSPNPWNPNRMSDFMLAKARTSIRQFGFVDPVLVRTGSTPDTLEIVDGEQRWRAALLEGLSEVSVMDLGSIDDHAAKRLTVVLNEVRGKFDRAELGKLIAGLLSGDDEALSSEIRDVLPYTGRELDALVKSSAFGWDDLDRENPVDSLDPRDTAEFKASKVFKLPATPKQAKTIRAAIDKAMKTNEADSEGAALVLLAGLWTGDV